MDKKGFYFVDNELYISNCNITLNDIKEFVNISQKTETKIYINFQDESVFKDMIVTSGNVEYKKLADEQFSVFNNC